MTKKIFRLRSIASIAVMALTMAASQLLAQTPPPGSPVATHGQLKVVGHQILDKNNQPVQLRGMSLYWSSGPANAHNYYNADVVKYLAKDWNSSLIRAAMGIDNDWGGQQRGYLVGDNSGGVSNKKRVTDVVDAAIEAGIYVIIDWHSHIAENNTNKAAEFFQEMATAYKDYPNVIYEIYNEPEEKSWAEVYKPYMQTVTDAIRAIDPNNLIIIGTRQHCKKILEAVENPITGNNLAYSFHFYAGSPGTDHKEDLRSDVYRAMTQYGKAVFATEFGTTHYSGNGDFNAVETDKWMAFMDDHKISWANWSLASLMSENNGGVETSAALRSGSGASTTPGVNGAEWTNANLSPSGQYILNELINQPNANRNMFKYLTVTIVGEGNVFPKWGTAGNAPNAPYMFDGDTSIYLRAGAAPGYKFVRWDGDVEPLTTLLSSQLRMDGNKHVIAIFESTDPNAKHNVTLSGTGRGSAGAGEYSSGARVIISSGVPPAGKKFVRWETASSDVTFKNAKKGKTEFTMPPGSVTITAVFE